MNFFDFYAVVIVASLVIIACCEISHDKKQDRRP